MQDALNHLVKTFAHLAEHNPLPSEAGDDHDGGHGSDHGDKGSHEGHSGSHGDVIVVDDLVSKAASVYEVLRNTIEYAEAHLLRRNAIRRILRRRMSGEEDFERVAQELLHELIWARYLPNKSIPRTRIAEVAVVLEKYRSLFEAGAQEPRPSRIAAWLLDMLATEIEHLLSPPEREVAMAQFAYATLREHMTWAKRLPVSEDEKDVQLYLAVQKLLLRVNTETLRFQVFCLFYPDWLQAESARIAEVAHGIGHVYAAVEHHVHHPVGEVIQKAIRGHIVVFKVLKDVLEQAGTHVEHLVHDPHALQVATEKAAKKRYKLFHSRLWRLVLRAVVFLFFTKLVMAFIIELPYEVLVIHETNFVPLLVNILFHPALLAVLGLTGTIPEKKNTQLLVNGVQSLAHGGSLFETMVTQKRSWSDGPMGTVFGMVYALMFFVSFGAITALLWSLSFNAVSIMLFLLFLSLVMFFGISIRASRRELVVVQEKGGFFSVIADMFTLPILRAGRWMSMHAPRVNVFLFFLDFIIEAPFKLVIQLVEGWLAFMKEKKDEVSN